MKFNDFSIWISYMLFPKKVKHRKWQKGRSRAALAKRGAQLAFGSTGIQTDEQGWLTSRQIEAARRVIVRAIRKRGKMWIRVFPDHPVTTKGNEVPMGGGKGSVDHYVAPVKPGRILFELDGVPDDVARDTFRVVGHKLPLKTRFVRREK